MNKWVNRKLDEKRTTGKGFTLIELIVVVTVLGILAAIVIYAVGNIQGAATKAASGTSGSEVTQAEQAYCQANGVYGGLPELTAGGYLTNPNPNITIYTNTLPANAQLFNGCGTSGSVYDVFPQTITQPDGTAATIPVPPTTVVSADVNGAQELLAALGVTPYGGVVTTYGAIGTAAFGANGITPLVNTAKYNVMGNGSPNYTAIAAAHPTLILGDGFGGPAAPLEAIAPYLSVLGNNTNPYPTNPQAGDLGLLYWVPQLVALANVMNLQPEAAAFITAFQNAAAAVEPTLAGKTVSIITPLAGSGATNTGTLVFGGLNGPTGANGALLEYLGMDLVCPNCAQGGSYTMSVANATQSTVTAQYLVIASLNGASNTYGDTLFGPGGYFSTAPNVLTQATTPGGVWGPNVQGNFGPSTGTPAANFATPVTVTLPSPLNGYCSIQGVSTAIALPNVNNFPSGITGAWCPGYGITPNSNPATYFTPTQTGLTSPPPQYTAVTLPGGINVGGPIDDIAAIPYIPVAFPAGG